MSSGRRRSKPNRIKHEAVEEMNEEVIMESGKASDAEGGDSKKLGKRKREHLTTKDAVRSTEAFAFFEGLVLELMEKPNCEDFLHPVLSMWSPSDVPDYMDRIKNPMDLGTIKRKLQQDKYTHFDKEKGEYSFDVRAMIYDVRLVFQNCMEYNEPKSALYQTAKVLLEDINQQVLEREAALAKQQEKAKREIERKRENERKRRKAAEEQAARAAANAKKVTAALLKARKEAEEAERRREDEMRRRELEWRRKMEEEKERAVATAVQEALAKQRRDSGRQSKLVNTSSVSSDEHEGIREVTFTFVSTAGMEKKRGRKSALVMELEMQHDELMKRRRAMVEAAVELEKMKQIEMTFGEKKQLCDDVGILDFVKMKAVVDIIARGMSRPDIVNEVEIDLDVDHIDNVVLREIQYFLKNPAAHTAKEALQKVEAELTEIETKLVEIRYQKVS